VITLEEYPDLFKTEAAQKVEIFALFSFGGHIVVP